MAHHALIFPFSLGYATVKILSSLHCTSEGPCVKIKMDCNKQEKIDKAYLLEGGGIRRLSVFGKYSDLDMLLWIKGLALDPCSSGASPSSVRSLWNQNIKVRKVMALSVTECPRVS